MADTAQLEAVTTLYGRPLPRGQIHAADFVRALFNRSLDWWARHRAEMESAYGFPKPVPPATVLVYWQDEIETWRKARRANIAEATRGKRVAQGEVGIAVTVPPAPRIEPNWDALKGQRE